MSKIRPSPATLNRLRPISIPKRVNEPVNGLKEANSVTGTGLNLGLNNRKGQLIVKA